MPNALALDLAAQKLYWSDARLDKIERTDLDGKHRVILAKVSPQHPFDIAVYGNYIFWTDWVLHAVLRANKFTGEDVVWLRKEVPRPMGIVAIHNTSYDCSANPCRSLNGGCEDLCRLDEFGKVGVDNLSQNFAQGNCLIGSGLFVFQVSCQCFPGRSPLLSDPSRCGTQSSNCSAGEFECSSGFCIPFHFTCDGVAECPDFSDELPTYCAFRKCLPEYFQCSNNR